MSNFAHLISEAQRTADGSLRYDVPAEWRQGRTAYGGLTTAIAYDAALRVAADLPKLRSAQIAFVGPAGAAIEARANLLRRGKSSAYVEVRAVSEGALALVAMFLFIADRPSGLNLIMPDMPKASAPEEGEPSMLGEGPAYRGQMEYRSASTCADDKRSPRLLRWVRLREREGIGSVSELLLIGDALPAGILPMLDAPPLISSANWTINLHDTVIETKDGWWLLESKADTAASGISHQSMLLGNNAGKVLLSGSQTVLFYAASVERT